MYHTGSIIAFLSNYKWLGDSDFRYLLVSCLKNFFCVLCQSREIFYSKSFKQGKLLIITSQMCKQ